MLTFAFLSVFTTAVASPVSAHSLKSDGDIGAVVHIDPNDDPIAGEPATFFFEFKDKSGRFKPENCDCNAIISTNGQQVTSIPFVSQTGNIDDATPSFTYTFPGKNIYTIKLVGTPKIQGDFQPFELQYDIRVERVSDGTGAETVAESKGFPYWIFIVVAIVFLVFLFSDRLKAAISKKSGKGTPLSCIIAFFLPLFIFLHAVPGTMVLQTHHASPDHDALHHCCLPQMVTSTGEMTIEPAAQMVFSPEIPVPAKPHMGFADRLKNKSPPPFAPSHLS